MPQVSHRARPDSDLTPPPPWEVQPAEVVQTTFGLNLAPKAPVFFYGIWWGLKI